MPRDRAANNSECPEAANCRHGDRRRRLARIGSEVLFEAIQHAAAGTADVGCPVGERDLVDRVPSCLAW